MKQPLTKDKLIDTDESFMIHLTDSDADYVVDIEDVRSALKGLCDEIESIINAGHEPIINKIIAVWFPVFNPQKPTSPKCIICGTDINIHDEVYDGKCSECRKKNVK